LGLILLLSVEFGWAAVLRSLLPLIGLQAYQALHFGWRGNAHELLYFRGVRLGYYIGTPVGFWTFSTLYLFIAALAVAYLVVKKNLDWAVNYEIILTCAALHLAFIALFYGSPASWTYYAYVLVVGIIATEVSAFAVAPVGALCVLAALANYSGVGSALKAWRTMKPSAATAGLFANAQERAEWRQITLAAGEEHPTLFAQLGGAEVLFPWLSRPAAAFMVPGVASDAEVQRENRQLRTASLIIIPTIPDFRNSPVKWIGSEFGQGLDGTKLVFKGRYFEMYRRRNPD
jgi:hypothetical protein